MGIDLGTGGVRCVLVNEVGSVVSESTRPLKLVNLSNKGGHSEQDPLDWIAILEDSLDELFSVPANRNLSAVSVDSTSGTILPVRQNGLPLANALLHNDMRSINQVIQCREVFGGDCSPTFSLPKILWMKEHMSLPKDALFFHATDFLNSWLCGTTDIPTDFTNAMKTGVDLETGSWSKNLPNLTLPKVVRPGQVIGNISSAIKNRWSLTGNCMVVSGATDSNAAFYASGASTIGDWSTTTGTTLAVKGLASRRIIDSTGTIYCHRHPDEYWMPGGASNAGGEIFKDTFGKRLAWLDMHASSAQIEPAIIYPSIRQGERLPFSNPHFSPFRTKNKKHEIEFFLGCVEGLAFVEKMTYELLINLGAEVGPQIFATGGAIKSRLGLEIRANVLQKNILVPQYPNSAMGAAILAAAGFHNRGVGEVSAEMVKIAKTIEPKSRSKNDLLNDRFERFKILCNQKVSRS